VTEALSLAGVDALYGESHVLHRISFSLNAGRVLALLGRNGCRQDNLHERHHRLPAAPRGEIRLFGETIGRLSPEAISRRGVGFRAAGTADLCQPHSAREPGRLQAEAQGVAVPWSLERVIELFPRLKERLQQAAGSLLGGEQQMLGSAGPSWAIRACS